MARIILTLMFLWQSMSISAANTCKTNTQAGGWYNVQSVKTTCEAACKEMKSYFGLDNLLGYMTFGDKCYCPSTTVTFPNPGYTVCFFGDGGDTGDKGSTGGSSGSSGSDGNTGTTSSDAEKACLDQHNVYRKRHGVAELTWDDSLASEAQSWADQLAKGATGHSGNSGENIASAWSTGVIKDLGKEAVVRWYKEICLYKGDICDFTSGIGHFTQVVWRDSKKLGCAVAKVGNKVYTVARYSPPGNYLGRFKENVGCGNDRKINRLRRKVDCSTK